MGDNTRTINKHANTSYSIGNRNTDYTYCGYYLVSLQYILKASYIRLDLCTKQGIFLLFTKKDVSAVRTKITLSELQARLSLAILV